MLEFEINKAKENKQRYDMLYRIKNGILVTAEWPDGEWVNQIDAYEDKEKEYYMQLAMYSQQCEALRRGFDNVPCVYFDFGRAAYLMAFAYGCEVIKINGLITAAHMYDNLEEAESFIFKEGIHEYGLYPVILDRIKEFQKRYGDIPITISDNQSPVDVLTSILNSEEALVAMHTEKEPIHRMLDIITHSVIKFNRYLEKTINNFGGFECAKYLPFGMHVSDDNAAFLSPQLYREFAMPYTERLSDEFGGIAFHCCMGYEQNLENMTITRGFLGFDAMPDYNNMDKILNAIDGRGVWNVYNFPYAVRKERQQDMPDEVWFKNIIDRSEGRCGLLFNVYGGTMDEGLGLAHNVKEYAEKKGRLLT